MYIIYDDFYLKHDNGPSHPENAGRLISIKNALDGWKLKDRIKIIDPREADIEEIEWVHDKEYVQNIKSLSESKIPSFLDPDTGVNQYTFQCAGLAAGAGFKGMDLISGRDAGFKKFFALVRPPGHHAFPSYGSGFCIFNNIAICARYAQKELNIKKIAILDFDVHHGNGTQDIFYQDGSIFYISFHEYPHYPGTGSHEETGSGEGKGFNLNFPFSAGTGDPDYLLSMIEIVLPLMERFKPQLLLISAGYDSHSLDPLSSLGLTGQSYYKMAFILSWLSRRFCQAKMGIFLEGGYEYEATSEGVLETIRGCLDQDGFKDPGSKEEVKDLLEIGYNQESPEITNPGLIFSLKNSLGL